MTRHILDAWDRLIRDWIDDQGLPLYARRLSAGRGCEIRHESGRVIVPTDNSPANWVLSLALDGRCPTLDEVRSLIELDRIPVAMMIKRTEKADAKYSCTRGTCAELNSLGWTVAHIEAVGLGRVDLASAPIGDLTRHFRLLMSPGNMFVVPKAWGALGELPEMVSAVKQADQGSRADQ